jgi:hypothetical protein
LIKNLKLKDRVVALIDVSIHGHHLAFMRLFAKALLELNCKVIVIIPESKKVDEWIRINCSNYSHNFYSLDHQILAQKTKRFGDYNHTVDTFLLWRSAAKHIKKAEKQFNIMVNFVFFAWLDSFLANYLLPQMIHVVFPYKWSGLYFHPRHLRINAESLKSTVGVSEIDVVLTATSCKNIAIHDQGIASKFAKRLNKPVIVFPEIADDSAPELSYGLAQEIKINAADRSIIGMIGLEKRKGTLTMLRLAKAASIKEFYFVFAGKIRYEDYSSEEADEILAFFNTKPDNCYIHLSPIEEGAKFNAVFCSFDIPFIVYDNFASTSNLVTKAAIFKKRVLATERYIIGEDVRAYNLGITVEEGNINQCLLAIQSLRMKQLDKEPFPESYEVYKELQSVKRLAEVFNEVLQGNSLLD